MSSERLTTIDKLEKISRECVNLPVCRYEPVVDSLFVEKKFNGCVSFVKFVLEGSGVTIPDFIGVDNVRRSMDHVNEFHDHFGVFVPFEARKRGDLIIFSWNGAIPQHIGIVVDFNHYVHAHTSDGGVHLNKISQKPILKKTERSIYTVNPIAIKRPTVRLDGNRWHQSFYDY